MIFLSEAVLEYTVHRYFFTGTGTAEFTCSRVDITRLHHREPKQICRTILLDLLEICGLVRYVPGRIFDSCNASKSTAVYDIDLHDQRTSVVALTCQGTIVSVPLYRSVGLIDAAIAI